MLLDKFQNGLN